MKLYVPEIGDHIRLTKPWTFTLHAESRNETLGSFFNYRLWNGWLPDAMEPEPERTYEINYPQESEFRSTIFGRIDWEARNKAWRKAEEESTSYQAYLKAYEEWRTKSESVSVPSIEVTLPVGTVLAIDRIYIRKGASDYSSITFWAKGLGEVELTKRWSNRKTKWKALRFWAKLSECNDLEFEPLEDKEVINVFGTVKNSK